MDSPKKPNKIRDIVRLQQILKKWRRVANSSKTSRSNNSNNNTSSRSINFLKRTLSISEREGGGSSSNVVPKGYVAVCVGVDLNREAEEEFGFEQTGVLRIPCEVSVFESILKIVERKDKFFTQKCRLSLEKMMGYCSSNNLAYSHQPQSPMCR
ncbi:hypothetical protein JHK85_015042 [Glycine max]|nr:hypothetical protein JHK85_015042 [Glycine max]